jgi:integrase
VENVVVRLLVEAGMGSDEIFSLRVGDVDLQAGTVRVPASTRRVRISPSLWASLQVLCTAQRGSTPVLRTAGGRPYGARLLARVLYTVARRTELRRLTAEQLRASTPVVPPRVGAWPSDPDGEGDETFVDGRGHTGLRLVAVDGEHRTVPGPQIAASPCTLYRAVGER